MQKQVSIFAVLKAEQRFRALIHQLDTGMFINHDQMDRQVNQNGFIIFENLRKALVILNLFLPQHVRIGKSDQGDLINILNRIGDQLLPVPNDCHPVGKVIDVINSMGDKEDREALRLTIVQNCDHLLTIFI